MVLIVFAFFPIGPENEPCEPFKASCCRSKLYTVNFSNAVRVKMPFWTLFSFSIANFLNNLREVEKNIIT